MVQWCPTPQQAVIKRTPIAARRKPRSEQQVVRIVLVALVALDVYLLEVLLVLLVLLQLELLQQQLLPLLLCFCCCYHYYYADECGFYSIAVHHGTHCGDSIDHKTGSEKATVRLMVVIMHNAT